MKDRKKSSANQQYSLAPNAKIDGTHFYKEVVLIPSAVVRSFGEGLVSDLYKSSRDWIFRKGPLVFTLYDWKSTSLYDSDMWSPDELWASTEPFDLHVGSKKPATIDDVDQFIAFLTQETSAGDNGGEVNCCGIEGPTDTAEPWCMTKIGDGQWMIHLEDGSCIAVVGDGVREGDPAQAEANGRLIAAAPELLEYCKMLLDDVTRMAVDPEVGIGWDWKLTETNLRKAVAKAEKKSAPNSEE